HAVSAIKRVEPYRLLEIAQLTLCPPHGKRSIPIHDGDPRRIIAPILKLSEAIQYNAHDRFVPNVSDDSAHSYLTSLLALHRTNSTPVSPPGAQVQITEPPRPPAPGLTHYLSFFFTTAGTPTTSVFAGTSSVTTAPAPVTDPLPTRTGATSIVSLPILT